MIVVSIIIINYNTLKLTKNIIKSIEKKTKKLIYEIILVDNNSQDGSIEYFQQIQKKNFKYIYSNKNLGFGKANNLGIKLAKGKYIFLLNTDTLLINNAIKILYDYMEQNQNIGVCGANLYDQEQAPNHSYGPKLPNIFMDFNEIYKKIYLKLMKRRLDFNYSKENKKVGYITGADMFIRKSVLDQVGCFDPDFFMYFEETELTYRIKKAGYDVVSVPEAKIIHLEGQSFQFKEKRFQMMVESKYKYLYKVFNEKKAFHNYIISQLKYLLIYTKENRQKFKINKIEYSKFKNGLKNRSC